MSAIGSYVVIGRSEFAECLELARQIHSETSVWMFQRSGCWLDEFRERAASRAKRRDFEYSGYVVGNYLDAQKAVNNVDLVDEQSEIMSVLCKAFLAAFVFEQSITLPVLEPQELLEFCREEYGIDDSQSAVAAITAAHEFYRRGLQEITNDHLVVFLIQ